MTTPDRLPREERAALQRAERRTAILTAGLFLAERENYKAITRDGVADVAGVAAGSVNHEFGTIEDLRRAVVAEAIAQECLPVIAQAVVDGHPLTAELDPDLKKRALYSLAV